MTTLWNLVFVTCAMCLLTCSRADWLQELQDGKLVSVGDGLKVRVDQIAGVNQTSYFSSHVLRVFLGDAGLSFAKAKGKEGLQISLFTPNADGNSEARGEANVFSVILPLLIGFKIAGSILTTLVAVLVVSLKAFLASIVALLVTGAGALKKMMTGHEIPTEVHYPMEYYKHPPTGYDYPSASGYHAPPHSAPSSPGAPDDHVEPTAADSNVKQQYITTNISKSDPHDHTGGMPIFSGGRRRNYKKKVMPVLTVSKITRKESFD